MGIKVLWRRFSRLTLNLIFLFTSSWVSFFPKKNSISLHKFGYSQQFLLIITCIWLFTNDSTRTNSPPIYLLSFSLSFINFSHTLSHVVQNYMHNYLSIYVYMCTYMYKYVSVVWITRKYLNVIPSRLFLAKIPQIVCILLLLLIRLFVA